MLTPAPRRRKQLHLASQHAFSRTSLGHLALRRSTKQPRLRLRYASLVHQEPDRQYTRSRSCAIVRSSGLTIRSSRRHFVARLNSGVRPLRASAPIRTFAISEFLLPAIAIVRFVARYFAVVHSATAQHKAAAPPASQYLARSSRATTAVHSGWVMRYRQEQWPNNSFKPMPLRGTA